MEVLEIYDNECNKTGRTVIRGDKNTIFNENEHILISIILIENDKGEFIIEKLPKDEIKYSSIGGHVGVGELPLDAIIRETKEEIGLDIIKEDVDYLGNIIVGVPLVCVYYTRKNANLSNLIIDKNEVESISYMNRDEIKELIKNDMMTKTHKIVFNEKIFNGEVNEKEN